MKTVSRRLFLGVVGGVAVGSALGRAQSLSAIQHRVLEWSFHSSRRYADPFNEVDLDVIVTGPDGQEHRVPAFWSGAERWRVRYAPPTPGSYAYRTILPRRGRRLARIPAIGPVSGFA